ncbi:MauE/DoxX family redox-associated membrane protein [Catellatospora sp. NPDC049609]|uniref:MauE/DoxX family redox-associated membrane protein n=1 Tax=Catellatospora sp. NPDC049609 TaxID=3155505 RepID=UPI00342C8671
MSHAVLVARAVLGVVFAVALVGKVATGRRRREFVDSIGAYRVGAGWRGPVAYAVVAVESALVVLLAAPGGAVPGLAAALGVLAVFTVATVRSGDAGACHCFGAAGRGTTGSFVARNVLLLGVAAIGLVCAAGAAGAPGRGGAVLAVGIGALVGVLVTRWDDLAALR